MHTIKSNVIPSLIVVTWFISFTGLVFASCPCSSPDLCKPITKKYQKQLVVFADAATPYFRKWNWTEITNVIVYSSGNVTDLYCFAHSKNVYVTLLVGTDPNKFSQLLNETYRKQVVSSWVKEFTQHQLDGINLDIEGPAPTDDDVNGISALAKDAYQTVKKLNSNYLVTFDIYYSPYLADCISFLCYNYTAIAQWTDYMITMDYDATVDLLIANSNSPLLLIADAYDQYINGLHIPAQHFVMAVPWYGYDYTCSHFYNASGGDVCVILGAASGQKTYAEINALYSNNLDGLKWLPQAKTPYFTLKEDNVYHQIQFDNVQSLTYKYELAVQLGLNGFGMWQASCLDYTSTDPKIQNQTAAMWNTLTEYVQKLKLK